jgi:hypothetical protein
MTLRLRERGGPNHKVGDQDPIGTAKVTKAEIDAASNGVNLFSMVVNDKKAGIAQFMYQNSKDAKNPAFFGNQEYDYNLFVHLYLKKDDSGNYVRKYGMWNVDKNGNYTPKPPDK